MYSIMFFGIDYKVFICYYKLVIIIKKVKLWKFKFRNLSIR